jgi:uncharacterized protein
MRFEEATHHILSLQESELPNHLTYHSIHHIRDVYSAASDIGRSEGISEPEMKLLLTAVCYHDAGFLKSMQDHETHSCAIAREQLPSFGYSDQDIGIICDLIMATRLPHAPGNLLEQIICDADLDYLGRDDFHPIGTLLRDELNASGTSFSESQWNQLQVNFLESHRYFTRTAIQTRDPKKQAHLAALRNLL